MSIFKYISVWLQRLWDKTKVRQPLSFSEKVIWIILIFFEWWYRAFFRIVFYYKRLTGGYRAPWPVVSVGNISLGGTGKSVFVAFLLKHCMPHAAVLTRGYGRISNKKNLLISDGIDLYASVSESGDEAYMLAQKTAAPVVVGASRASSCSLLERSGVPVSALILDDAFQHHSLYKDMEILLLDARYPFENSHCLPAGRLREMDISRADIIVATHADACSHFEQKKLIDDIQRRSERSIPVLLGRHTIEGIFINNSECMPPAMIKNNAFFACAGVGSWSGFLSSIDRTGAHVVGTKRHEDHYHYDKKDVEAILEKALKYKASYIITTEKDWVKIEPLLSKNKLHGTVSWCVLRIEFQFLSDNALGVFMEHIKRIHQ